MCARYTLTTPADDLAEHFEVPNLPQLTPRYNVAPSQVVAVVGLKPDGVTRGMVPLKWGLVPHWAADPAKGPKPVNVRAETVDLKFPNQFRERRCLIPASGFFEWREVGGKKQACHFTLASGEPFGFAGVWDVWVQEEEKLFTCALITTTANELVRPLHERMPVILPRESYGEWLDPETPIPRLLALLRPYPADLMKVTEVGPAVNSSKNEGPQCLEAA